MTGRVVVVGASGLIGGRMMEVLGERAVGTYCHTPRPGMVPFDLGADDPGAFLDRCGEGVTHALIFGGEVRVDACADDPEGTARINVAGAKAFIDAAVARSIVPVYASTDAVYGDKPGRYRESDPLAPAMVYGRHKAAVEAYLASLPHPWLVLRFAKVLDPGLSRQGVLGPLLADLAEGRLIRCVRDQRFSPVGIDDAGYAIRDLMAAGASGVFNVGGPVTVSRLDLLNSLIDSLSRVRPVAPRVDLCAMADLGLREPRSLDCSLSIEKLRKAVRYVPRTPTDLCEEAVSVYVARLEQRRELR